MRHMGIRLHASAPVAHARQLVALRGETSVDASVHTEVIRAIGPEIGVKHLGTVAELLDAATALVAHTNINDPDELCVSTMEAEKLDEFSLSTYRPNLLALEFCETKSMVNFVLARAAIRGTIS